MLHKPMLNTWQARWLSRCRNALRNPLYLIGAAALLFLAYTIVW